MTTRRNFSFLRPMLMWGGLGVLALIVCAVLFGFVLGQLFSIAMVIYAGAAVLYGARSSQHETSAIVRNLRGRNSCQRPLKIAFGSSTRKADCSGRDAGRRDRNLDGARRFELETMDRERGQPLVSRALKFEPQGAVVRIAFVFISLAVLEAGAAMAPDLSWMAGYWLSCSENGEVSETWSDPRGSVMLGTSFTLSKGRPSWEFSRIGPSGDGISFFAQPSGQAPAEFRAVKISDRRVVFENMQHDFPQRVIYARDGDRLTGRIEGVINGAPQSAEWQYAAAKLNARCPAK